MLNIIKKIFSIKQNIIVSEQKNTELIISLNTILDIDDLEETLSKPESYILLLNVYHRTFVSLLDNVLQKSVPLNLISINVYEYFKNEIKDIKRHIERLIPILETNEINYKINEELTEVVNMILFLNRLQNGK